MVAPPSPDIIHCVFTSLPDFATLFSAILVSKSFHEVFQAHPSSILASVTKTQIGPELLPCAIRLAHSDRNKYLASRADYVQGFPSKKFSHNDASEITSHVVALARNDSAVIELELFFSTMCVLLSIHPCRCSNGCFWNRCKDRTSGARSLLNSNKSLRFRRAFYRWWLLINLFPSHYLRPTREVGMDAGDEGSDASGEDDGTETDDDTDGDRDDDTDDDTDDDDNTNTPYVYIKKSQVMRKEFLREFSDNEVAEMWQVHSFMLFASSCAWNALQSPAIPGCGSI